MAILIEVQSQSKQMTIESILMRRKRNDESTFYGKILEAAKPAESI